MRKRIAIITIIVSILATACSGSSDTQKQDLKAHHTQSGFKNLYVEDTDKSFFDFLRMRLLGDEKWADHPSLASQVPQQKVDLTRIQSLSEQPQITWLGHSMFLIQYAGINILSDPIFTDRASPLSFAGPKRYIAHAMDYQQLPKIDIVVISHNHYDHLDNTTLKLLQQRSLQQNSPTRFYVPLGVKQHLLDLNIAKQYITEMDWWDTHTHPNTYSNVKLRALPSQHWSARGLTDRLQSLWASWHIKVDDFSLWFAGDTGYNDIQFKQIGERIDNIDLALIPIGAYAPRWFMQKYHVNPAEAIRIHQDVGAKQSIGMHWGTFPLTAEEPGEPVKVLAAEKQKNAINDEQFLTMSVGQTLSINWPQKTTTQQ